MTDSFDNFLSAISTDTLPLPTEALDEKTRHPDASAVFSNLTDLNDVSSGGGEPSKQLVRGDSSATTAMFAMLDIEGKAAGSPVDPFAAVVGPQEKQVRHSSFPSPAARS